MAFPYKKSWYLIKHHRLIEKIGMHTNWLKSDSWISKRGYTSVSINAELLEALAEDLLGPVYGPVAEQDDEQALAESV